MRHIIKTIIGILPALALLTGCTDQFGEKLFGPDTTVAPETVGDQTMVFLNMTDADESGTPVTATPVDVIFSAAQPVGQTKDITMSARIDDGRSLRDCNFIVGVRDGQELYQAYEDAYGYAVSPLPEGAYRLMTDIISIETGGQTAVSRALVRIVNSSALEADKDYLLILGPGEEQGFVIEESNSLLYIHVKRRGGSGALAGAADFRPMSGDNALDANGVDLGINRNNLYYTLSTDDMADMAAFTLEGLIYVDSFKDDTERGNSTLAGISSVWGYEGGSCNFLLRFGDASINPDRLQLILGGNKYIIDYTFREKQWYHIALTYDGTSVGFYVNGRERFSTEKSGVISLSTDGRFHLGQSFNQWRGFNGMMSEVRVWNVARTSSQLRDNALDLSDMNAVRNQLVAYWKMNEAMAGSGNKMIEDVSGHGNDITVARQGAANADAVPTVVINNDIDINLR